MHHLPEILTGTGDASLSKGWAQEPIGLYMAVLPQVDAEDLNRQDVALHLAE